MAPTVEVEVEIDIDVETGADVPETPDVLDTPDLLETLSNLLGFRNMTIVAMIGDSMTASGISGSQTYNRYLPGYLAMYGGFAFNNVLEYGTGGEGLEDMLGRTDTMLADTWDICVIQGGVNDLPTLTVDEMKEAYTDIAAKVRRAGRSIVATTILPRSVGLTDAQIQNRKDFNTWLVGQPSGPDALFNVIVDLRGTKYEKTFFGPDTQSTDGVHPQPVACMEIMRKVVDTMLAHAVALGGVSVRPVTNDRMVNPGMIGNDGDIVGSAVSGKVPNDWRVNRTRNGTENVVCSVVQRSDHNSLAVDLSGTPTGATNAIIIYSPAIELTAGKDLRTVLRLRAADLQGVCGIETQMRMPNGGGTDVLYSFRRGGTDDDRNLLPPNFNDCVMSLPATVPEDTTAAELRFVIYTRDGAELGGRLEFVNPEILEYDGA